MARRRADPSGRRRIRCRAQRGHRWATHGRIDRRASSLRRPRTAATCPAHREDRHPATHRARRRQCQARDRCPDAATPTAIRPRATRDRSARGCAGCRSRADVTTRTRHHIGRSCAGSCPRAGSTCRSHRCAVLDNYDCCEIPTRSATAEPRSGGSGTRQPIRHHVVAVHHRQHFGWFWYQECV